MTRLLIVMVLTLGPLTAAAQDATPVAAPDPVMEAVAEAVPETIGETVAGAEPAMTGFAPIPAAEADLAQYIWRNRVAVVFANSEFDPAFGEQMRNFEALWPEMVARDVVVIIDTDPAAMSEVRTKLRPRGFMLVLIGKDGTVVLRKPFPWDVRELSRSIDKLPLRLEELRVQRMTPN